MCVRVRYGFKGCEKFMGRQAWVELAFRPASTFFILDPEPALASGSTPFLDFFSSLFSRAERFAARPRLYPRRNL
jgi:hypothetical protein